MDLTQYNSSNEPLPDEGGNDKLPDGKYGAECAAFKTDHTSGGYRFIEFEWVILDPRHAGRRVWQKTWLYPPCEPDEKKRKMGASGEKDRDRIAEAIGLPKLTDANQDVGKPAVIVLKTKGEWQNVTSVTSYGAHSGPPPASATIMPQQQAQQTVAAEIPF